MQGFKALLCLNVFMVEMASLSFGGTVSIRVLGIAISSKRDGTSPDVVGLRAVVEYSFQFLSYLSL